MNFFEQQDKARKRTFVLLFLYALAVAATVFSVYAAARVCWYLFNLYAAARSESIQPAMPFIFWDTGFFLTVTGIVCGVILIGTIIKIMEFSSGGAAVGQAVGGIQILPNTIDPDERKVLNVVEEMSIASGVPVPAVFLLSREYGINAFAAGFSIQDAVIGVTQGAVKLLSRDELQGIIAHEFSHIFNGDMRLNMNLTGFLNGLLLIALTGKTFLRTFRGGRVRSGRGGGGAAIIALFLFALLLVIVGYAGVFFCNLIKSAISRQREFLADATSAQYTRNPSGLAGALKKIGGLADGSLVQAAKAEAVSHFFFADAVTFLGESLFPTHPPLDLRIKLLEPSFDGKFPAIRSIAPKIEKVYKSAKETPQLDKKASEWERKVSIFRTPIALAGAGEAALAASVVSTVGTVTKTGIDEAGKVLHEIPATIREASKNLSGAAAIVYGLLIDRMNSEIRAKQLDHLAKTAEPSVYQTLLGILPEFTCLKIEFCLPLIDLATPTLKTQSGPLYKVFRERIQALIRMDEKVTVFELALKQVVLHHLDFYFGMKKKPPLLYGSIEQVIGSCEVLLSYLAGTGTVSKTMAEVAFQKAAKDVSTQALKLIPPATLEPLKVEDALAKMASAYPLVKEKFLKACVNCVEHDGKLEVAEMELLRAFASTLDCPIPPFSLKGKA